MYQEGQYGLHDKFVNEVFKDIFWLKGIVRSNEHTDSAVKAEFLDFASRYEQAKGFIEYDFKYFEID